MKTLRALLSIAWWGLCVLLLINSCTPRQSPSATTVSKPVAPATASAQTSSLPLRVGATPNFPPIVFKEQGVIKGLEADLAHQVGEALARRIVWVELAWDDLLPALESKQIDIIMSGMSATPARQRRVQFVEPYLRVGQMALIRKESLLQTGSPSLLYRTQGRVGFEAGTTGATFVQENLSKAEPVALSSPEAGINALRTKQIDVFVHDAPTIWRAAGDPANDTLMGLYWPLTEEHLAWAVHKNNNELRQQLDALLADWKRTGRLQGILHQWLQVRVEVK